MNNKIFVTIVLIFIATGAVARQCYQCVACPKPFQGNEAGVSKVNVGDDEYCQKFVDPILKTESRGSGGSDCTPTDKIKFCCKGDLCNSATTTAFSVKILAAMTSLLFAMRFFY